MASLALPTIGGCSPHGGIARPDFAAQDLQGYIAADEPRAAAVAARILQQGGNAVDAGVALGLALSVTLPSRASLGGGGGCLVRQGRDNEARVVIGSRPPEPPLGTPQAITFMPRGAHADDKLGRPMLARGLSLIHARFGRLRWGQLVAPAENMARFGAPVARAFIADIAAARAEISGPAGKALGEGDWLPQGELGETLAALRTQGVNNLAGSESDGAVPAESADPTDAANSRQTAPSITAADSVAFGNETAYFSATPGGVLAASLWRRAKAAPFTENLVDRFLWSFGATSVEAEDSARIAALAAMVTETEKDRAPSPDAATSFIVIDRGGGAIACSLGMGRLFGVGRIIPKTGILASLPVPGVASDGISGGALIVTNDHVDKLLAAFTGGGGERGAAVMVETALGILSGPRKPEQVMAERSVAGEEGARRAEVNAFVCPAGLPAEAPDCHVFSDPRGDGVGLTVRRTDAEGRTSR